MAALQWKGGEKNTTQAVGHKLWRSLPAGAGWRFFEAACLALACRAVLPK